MDLNKQFIALKIWREFKNKNPFSITTHFKKYQKKEKKEVSEDVAEVPKVMYEEAANTACKEKKSHNLNN